MVLHVLHERSESGGPILAGSEAITYTAGSITMVFGDADPVGVGSLFVTTERIVWLEAGKETGYAVDVPSIGMHAVARDSESFDKPCLLIQLLTEDDAEEPDEDDVKADPTLATQIRFVPEDPSLLDGLFTAFSDVAALHPDPADEGDDGAFIGDFGGNGDVSEFMSGELAVIGRSIDIHDTGVEGESYDERRARVLAHLDGVLDEGEYAGAAEEDGQFDDVDEEAADEEGGPVE